MPIVFYSRCRPQYSDAAEIALANNIVFIGYPLWRIDAPYDAHRLDTCLVSPAEDWDVWQPRRDAVAASKQYRKNYNLVREVTVGSIALLPRASRGLVYAGAVTSQFEVVADPPWYDAYIALRKRQGLYLESDEARHAGDIAQIWRVAEWIPLPFPEVPAWVRSSLFGRPTYNRIHPKSDTLAPHAVLTRLMQRGEAGEPLDWTLKPAAIFERLAIAMAPNNFEHLVVSLLQLEHPAERWSQVGGSGDGGADGLGYTDTGDLCGILQCKLIFGSDAPRIDALDDAARTKARLYFASLHHPARLRSTDTIEVLGKDEVVALVRKHWQRLPEALSMRVGQAPVP